MSSRQRPGLFALIAIVSVWLVALGGYAVFQHSKMTAEKIRAYLAATDLSKLSAADRAKAIRDLIAKISALSPEERQNARLGHLWDQWFAQMTEEEKGMFLDGILPSGFKQMMTAFEKLPPDRRHQVITNSVEKLREAREASPEDYQKMQNKNAAKSGTNQPPVLSEDLQKKVAMIGLKSVYGDSSAETKAELAPLMEEIQKNMESGRMFRNGGGGGRN